jgi:plastocyanin
MALLRSYFSSKIFLTGFSLLILLFGSLGTVFILNQEQTNISNTTGNISEGKTNPTPTAHEADSKTEQTTPTDPTTPDTTPPDTTVTLKQPAKITPPPPPATQPPPPTTNQTWTVNITSSGAFSPANLNIKKGDSVMWVNGDNSTRWPASDPHPTHTSYAGFDSRGITPGSSWSFVFNNTGTWGWHDHLNSSTKGTITVSN